MSWVDIVNSEEQIVAEKQFNGDHQASTSTEQVTINDILKVNIESIEYLKLLEYQLIILSQIKKNFKIEYENKNRFLSYVNWILQTNKYLCSQFKLQEVEHKNPNWNTGNIPRSSYKFCDYNCECQFYYKEKKCYAHHFVFNLVIADIDILIKYVKYIDQNNMKVNEIEVQKCLNTLSYVITHMFDELTDGIERGTWKLSTK